MLRPASPAAALPTPCCQQLSTAVTSSCSKQYAAASVVPAILLACPFLHPPPLPAPTTQLPDPHLTPPLSQHLRPDCQGQRAPAARARQRCGCSASSSRRAACTATCWRARSALPWSGTSPTTRFGEHSAAQMQTRRTLKGWERNDRSHRSPEYQADRLVTSGRAKNKE